VLRVPPQPEASRGTAGSSQLAYCSVVSLLHREQGIKVSDCETGLAITGKMKYKLFQYSKRFNIVQMLPKHHEFLKKPKQPLSHHTPSTFKI